MSNTSKPPPMPIIHGEVKFFAADAKKNFGFIVPDGQEPGAADVHFHLNNGKFVAVGKGRPWFIDPKPDQEPLRQPKTGDRVVYRAKRSGRSSAHVWAFESDWEQVEEEMGLKVNPTRVVSNPPPEVNFPTTTNRWDSEGADTTAQQKDNRNHGRHDGRSHRGRRGNKSQQRRR